MQLNSSKPIAGLVATLFLFYVVYFLLADSPLKRTERFCAPMFVWTSKAVVAATDIFIPEHSAAVARKFDGGMNSCRLWVWNAFYREEYERLKRAAAGGAAGGGQ